jgi:O-acetyl-ADP-ribose deacetylase (regulator of RNase III)
MRLHLVDRSASIVDAWRSAFAGISDVDILQADILAVAHTAIVSPANSYGYMNGGIDLAYRHFFGVGIESAVQAKIKEVAGAYLPVGRALLVETQHERIPYLISAPTMFLPEPIPAENCRLAMEATLRLARLHPNECADVFCPGLGTGVGRVPPDEAAAAMKSAYVGVTT